MWPLPFAGPDMIWMPISPHVKWYPLGATCEFKISAGPDSCRWRMLYGQRPKTENTEWNRHIELGKLYKMAARVETIDLTTSRYSAKLWDAALPEPVQWDLVGIKENETMFSGSALLLSHNTDVSFGNVSITKIPSEGPQPGDIYCEYAVNLKNGNWWRVTDPDAGHSGAADFLPNPVLEINIDDLEGAVRAEILMDIWGGHAGTSGKKFRFNDKAWMDVPKVPTIPQRSECYMTEYNVILDLPLRYLKEGINTFEGTSGGQICYNFNWGQWGWYVMMVRVYYGPGKSHAVGQITWPASGGTISENPEIVINPEDPGNVNKIQVIGNYYGYDENGDGLYFDWHRAYHGTEIEGHIGTITQAPYHLTWDTRFVPDQDSAGIFLVARIRDTSGIWFVTNVVNSIHLERPDSLSVRMFNSYDIPEKFTVRAGKTLSCKNDIETLENAISCRMYHRTWNAGDDHAAGGHIDKPLIINGHNFKCYGKNHFFALSSVEIPVSNLYEGINEIAYTSDTEHHGIEILWPGPAFIVRYTPLTLSPPGN